MTSPIPPDRIIELWSETNNNCKRESSGFGGKSFFLKGQKLMQEYEQLKSLVESVEDDIIKTEGGNRAAGTRVRKAMQEVKQLAQAVRTKILESRAE